MERIDPRDLIRHTNPLFLTIRTGGLAMTYTYAILDISPAAFEEIAAKLRAAGNDHAFDRDVIDMHGIAVRIDENAKENGVRPPSGLGTPRHALKGDDATSRPFKATPEG